MRRFKTADRLHEPVHATLHLPESYGTWPRYQNGSVNRFEDFRVKSLHHTRCLSFLSEEAAQLQLYYHWTDDWSIDFVPPVSAEDMRSAPNIMHWRFRNAEFIPWPETLQLRSIQSPYLIEDHLTMLFLNDDSGALVDVQFTPVAANNLLNIMGGIQHD